jgi:hypothetical protein
MFVLKVFLPYFFNVKEVHQKKNALHLRFCVDQLRLEAILRGSTEIGSDSAWIN